MQRAMGCEMSVDCPHCDRTFDSHRAKSVHASQIHFARVPAIQCDPYGHKGIDTKHNGTRHRVQVHRLHATLLVDDIGELAEKEIHHVNGCPFDNRLENYEILDTESHRAKSQETYRNLSGFKVLCRECGTPNQLNKREDTNFCPTCGSRVEDEEIVRSEPIDWRIPH